MGMGWVVKIENDYKLDTVLSVKYMKMKSMELRYGAGGSFLFP